MSLSEEDLKRFPATDHVVVARVFDQDGGLVAVLPNRPPADGPLRVLHGLLDRDGHLTPEKARAGLETLAKGGLDKGNRVADLLHGLPDGAHYSLAIIASPVPGLLDKLARREGEPDDLTAFVNLLNAGDIRAAEKENGVWTPQPYVIDGILNCFKVWENRRFTGGWWDKIALKTAEFSDDAFEAGGVRYAPGCQVRNGCYIGPGTVVMNHAFVNIGAYIAGSGVMIDAAARVASCAQIGKNVKFGAGTGIEGILEPVGRLPSIVEDNAKIGAMCEISGIVGEGAVVASGVVMASGKKIFDEGSAELVPPLPVRVGETTYLLPVIPPHRLAVGGSLLSRDGNYATDAIILKPGDLRDSGTLKHFEKQGVLYS